MVLVLRLFDSTKSLATDVRGSIVPLSGNWIAEVITPKLTATQYGSSHIGYFMEKRNVLKL